MSTFFVIFEKEKQQIMKKREIITEYGEYRLDELPDDERRLVEQAKRMTQTSHAPYSKFHVGAAILMANGETVLGSNQENAAFSAGTCAERTACFHASALYPGVAMKKIAIAAWTREHKPADASDEECFQDSPISPCGVCRQALLEYENLHGPIRVIMYGRDKTVVIPSVASLLPFCFTEF